MMRERSVVSMIMLILVVLLLGLDAICQQEDKEHDQLELVESVPLETDLDLAAIRNTYDVWLELIRGAGESIDLAGFYISVQDGETMDHIISELKVAAGRGVTIRMLVEEKMNRQYPETIHEFSKVANVSARVISYEAITGGVMHAKYFIVDGETIFLGSQNFDWRALSHIHELGIRIKSKTLCDVFCRVFDMDWRYALKNEVVMADDSSGLQLPLSLNLKRGKVNVMPAISPRGHSLVSDLWDEPLLVNLIETAKREIDIQLLTYSPQSGKRYYEVLDLALRRAASRGVKVNMICSDWSMRRPTIDHLKSLSLVPNITVKLSTIPEFTDGFIPYARVEHAKYMLIDGERYWIGSSNWSRDYFHESRNVGIIIEDEVSAKLIEAYFYNSWNSGYAQEVDACRSYTAPRISD
ncbi:phospholipase [candidate division KSB1 bacterium]|nr:phospholipase [candidate division KSB1 bacterium]